MLCSGRGCLFAWQLEVHLDTETLTLQDMVDRVLKRRLGINEPTVSLAATTLLEEGEGADERLEVNLPKLLKVRSDPGDEMSGVQT